MQEIDILQYLTTSHLWQCPCIRNSPRGCTENIYKLDDIFCFHFERNVPTFHVKVSAQMFELCHVAGSPNKRALLMMIESGSPNNVASSPPFLARILTLFPSTSSDSEGKGKWPEVPNRQPLSRGIGLNYRPFIENDK